MSLCVSLCYYVTLLILYADQTEAPSRDCQSKWALIKPARYRVEGVDDEPLVRVGFLHHNGSNETARNEWEEFKKHFNLMVIAKECNFFNS